MDLGMLAQMGQGLLGGENSVQDNATESITALIPKEFLDKLPPALRTIVTSKAVDEVAKQAPEIYQILKKGGKLTGSDTEKLKSIIVTAIQSANK